MAWGNEVPDPKIKTPLSITEANVRKLARIKKQVKRRGRVVTRSGIIHWLIEHADSDQVIAEIAKAAK